MPYYYSSSPSPDRRLVIRRRRSGSSWGRSWGSRMSGQTWIERNSRGDPVLVRKRTRYGSGLSSLTDAFTSRPRLLGRSVSEEIQVITDPEPSTEVVVHTPSVYPYIPNAAVTTVVTNPCQALVADPPPPFPFVRDPYGRFVSPHRAEGKHTCGACGKFRSPSYHARHPLAQGQVPTPTLCRRCKSIGTDSEDSEIDSDLAHRRKRDRRRLKKSWKRELSLGPSLDSYEEERYVRRASRIDIIPRPRSPSPVVIVRRRSLSRDSYNYPYESHRRHYYRSSSLDPRPSHLSSARRERSLSLSPARVVERRVRYVDSASPPDVSYIRRCRGSRYSSYHEDDWEDLEDERDVVYSSRPRIVRRQSSVPVVRRARSTSRFRYRDELSPIGVRNIEHTETRVRSRSRPPSRSVRTVRVAANDNFYDRRRGWYSDEDERKVTFSRSTRGRSRTRDSYSMEDSSGRRNRQRSVVNIDDGDHYSPPERISDLRRYRSIDAPSPPPAAPWNPQRRYLATRPHDEMAEITRTMGRTRLSPSPVRRVVSNAVRRTRSRSRSISGRHSPIRRRSRSGFAGVREPVAERVTYPEETVARRSSRRVRVREV